MQNLRTLISCGVVLLMFLIISCEKYPDDYQTEPPVWKIVTDSISGIIYWDCNFAPDKYRKLVVTNLMGESDLAWDEWSDTIYTDSLGRFKVVHSWNMNQYQSAEFVVLIPDTAFIIWPSATSFPYHSFVVHDTMHVAINLQTSQQFSSADTLYFQFGNLPYYKIVGPFNSGFIGSYDVPRFYSSGTIDSLFVNLDWAIGYNDFTKWKGTWNYHTIKHAVCTSGDTAIIILN